MWPVLSVVVLPVVAALAPSLTVQMPAIPDSSPYVLLVADEEDGVDLNRNSRTWPPTTLLSG